MESVSNLHRRYIPGGAFKRWRSHFRGPEALSVLPPVSCWPPGGWRAILSGQGFAMGYQDPLGARHLCGEGTLSLKAQGDEALGDKRYGAVIHGQERPQRRVSEVDSRARSPASWMQFREGPNEGWDSGFSDRPRGPRSRSPHALDLKAWDSGHRWPHVGSELLDGGGE